MTPPKESYHYPGDRFVKRNKYSARSAKCETKTHPIHHSMLEADQCNVMNASRRPYSIQFKVDLESHGKHICNHYIDFAIHRTWKDAAVKIRPIKFIETKGYATEDWKLKRKLTEAQFPKVPYEVLGEKPRNFR